MTAYFRHKNRCQDILNRCQIWRGSGYAKLHAQMRTAPLGTGPEPDVLTGVIYSNCRGCFHVLRNLVSFPFSSFSDFGYSFLGIALTLGRQDLARGLANIVTGGHVIERVNPKSSMEVQTSSHLLQNPVIDGIFEPILYKMHAVAPQAHHIERYVWWHERAHICRDVTVALAHWLLQERCNVADGIDSNTQDTLWQMNRLPCLPLVMIA